MNSPTIKIQKSSDKMWEDEKGIQVPYSRVDSLERLQERSAGTLHTHAVRLHQTLSDLKLQMREMSQEIFARTMAKHDVAKPTKGNFTWFNFDRSIKIEVNVNENIAFDDALILACQSKLNEFLDQELSDKQEYFRSLINDAFSKSRGGLDAKKVLGLLKHRSKIKSKLFQEALNLLEQSIRRPDSRTYYRISERMEDGKYKIIDLNFSSI